MRIPIIPTIALVSTLTQETPRGASIWRDITEGNWEMLLYDARELYTGFDNTGRLRPEWLVGTWGPVIAGALVSKFAGKFVNPSIKKIPYIGKYIKL